jgi:hypothetical protein
MPIKDYDNCMALSGNPYDWDADCEACGDSKECHDCDGTGCENATDEPCPDCNGTGDCPECQDI